MCIRDRSWTVTSTLATQLARLYMRSQQRPAPRHQAAFGAAPEPDGLAHRLRERSGQKGMPDEAGRGEGGRLQGSKPGGRGPSGTASTAEPIVAQVPWRQRHQRDVAPLAVRGCSGALRKSVQPESSPRSARERPLGWGVHIPVSYTHLTLPTICSV